MTQGWDEITIQINSDLAAKRLKPRTSCGKIQDGQTLIVADDLVLSSIAPWFIRRTHLQRQYRTFNCMFVKAVIYNNICNKSIEQFYWQLNGLTQILATEFYKRIITQSKKAVKYQMETTIVSSPWHYKTALPWWIVHCNHPTPILLKNCELPNVKIQKNRITTVVVVLSIRYLLKSFIGNIDLNLSKTT